MSDNSEKTNIHYLFYNSRKLAIKKIFKNIVGYAYSYA